MKTQLELIEEDKIACLALAYQPGTICMYRQKGSWLDDRLCRIEKVVLNVSWHDVDKHIPLRGSFDPHYTVYEVAFFPKPPKPSKYSDFPGFCEPYPAEKLNHTVQADNLISHEEALQMGGVMMTDDKRRIKKPAKKTAFDHKAEYYETPQPKSSAGMHHSFPSGWGGV